VKLANTSFYPGIHKSMPSTTGMTIVSSAVDGSPLGVFQDNRYLTNLRTGATGAIAVKYLTGKSYYHHVAYIGTGEIAYAMAESAHWVNRFEQGYAYGLDKAETQHFANEIHNKLGYRIRVCETAEEAVRNAEVVFTQTTSTSPVLEASWFKPHASIIASGADQPGKNELPVSLLQHCKLVTDLTSQCAKNGELRTAIEQGGLSEESVYAELGEIIRGAKPGRQPEDQLIVVDLTGTGAQDAAVGQYAWETLRMRDGSH
jgi:ornithine cyclodeaminase/alanine dehydrogenase-like protein (mu-crystallin family)